MDSNVYSQQFPSILLNQFGFIHFSGVRWYRLCPDYFNGLAHAVNFILLILIYLFNIIFVSHFHDRPQLLLHANSRLTSG